MIRPARTFILDERTEQMQSEQQNQRSGYGGKRFVMLLKKTADSTGGGTKPNEYHGETDDEGKRRGEQSSFGLLDLGGAARHQCPESIEM